MVCGDHFGPFDTAGIQTREREDRERKAAATRARIDAERWQGG